MRCTMRSVWQEWHSPTHYLESFIPWHIRQVQRSQIMVHISFTDAANAMYLPKVIAFNAKDETAKERYGVIADFMKLGGETL